MASFKEIAQTTRQRLSGGHRMCAGCGATMLMRQVLHSLKPEDEVVVTAATGCMEVSTTIYPFSAWRCSYIHNAFENAGATCSGVETAYRALKKKGKMPHSFKFLAFGGDGVSAAGPRTEARESRASRGAGPPVGASGLESLSSQILASASDGFSPSALANMPAAPARSPFFCRM